MRLDAPFVLDVGLPEVRKSAADDGDFFIEGYCADFDTDREGEAFLPNAFDDAVERAADGAIPILHEHDNNRQLGVVEQLRVDEGKGLWMRGRIAKAVGPLSDTVSKIKRGMMKGLSVRGLSRNIATPQGVKIGWIDLAEVSVTPVPMQPGALFAVAQKSLNYDDESDIAWAAEGWAKVAANYTPEQIREAVRAYYQRRLDEMVKCNTEVQAMLADLPVLSL